MNIGVLLLYTQAGRQTTFTRDWADRAVGRLAAYISDQSGGRETITYKVFDWIQLSQTAEQWVALGFGAYSALKSGLENKIGESLDPYTHILIGIDHPQSSGGSTPGTFTHLAARNFTPSLMAHELGHRYGADDAFSESAEGPVRYQNNFCVMGAMNWPAVFADDTLTDPEAPNLNQNGPNMSAPTLLATGWLKENEHGVGLDLTNSTNSFKSGITTDLSALSGAPKGTWTRPPLMIRYQDLLIEYRVGGSSAAWDQGLPNPGTGAGGWLVMHRSPRGTPVAVIVTRLAARPGATLVLGDDNPLDIFNLGPLKISVISYNDAERTVRLRFSQRAARQLPSGTIYGGVDVGGGGYVWTPGRGFTPVPPRSPLLGVLEQIANIQSLQEIMSAVSREEAAVLTREVTIAVQALQESVAELHIEPAISPLSQALERISRLESISERLNSNLDDREQIAQYIEAGRRQLADLKSIIAAAEEERNR